ncbi:hypothetical protein [uncultured Nocardioides sp.]|uniref:hypothetical protein n=1 Tax=uncultured Nocardioides sp. TaxID=198441 RepID=UPI002624A56A|nr:hypothetical protein [uncultured Nocardioides sp.]
MSAASPPPRPLPQSPEYARLLHHLRVEAQWRDLPGGRCLVQSRRFGPLGHVSLISRGPVTAAPQAALDGLRALAATCPGPLVVNAPALDADGLRDAGFWPLLTPATVGLVRLGAQPQMRARLKAKWRSRKARQKDRARDTGSERDQARTLGLEHLGRHVSRSSWWLLTATRR